MSTPDSIAFLKCVTESTWSASKTYPVPYWLGAKETCQLVLHSNLPLALDTWSWPRRNGTSARWNSWRNWPTVLAVSPYSSPLIAPSSASERNRDWGSMSNIALRSWDKTLERIQSRRKSKNSRGNCLVYKAIPLWTAERGWLGGEDKSGDRKDAKEQWAMEF